MFEGDSADTWLKYFRWCQLGAERRVKRVQTQEQGPPSAPAGILCFVQLPCVSKFVVKGQNALSDQSFKYDLNIGCWDIIKKYLNWRHLPFEALENLINSNSNYLRFPSLEVVFIFHFYFPFWVFFICSVFDFGLKVQNNPTNVCLDIHIPYFEVLLRWRSAFADVCL